MGFEPKSTRKAVFEAIEGERRYQDLKPRKKGTDVAVLPVAGEIIAMQQAVYRAMLAYGSDGDECRALDAMREAVAFGVRCLENHGVIERVW